MFPRSFRTHNTFPLKRSCLKSTIVPQWQRCQWSAFFLYPYVVGTRVVSLAGPGSGLSLWKCFGTISGPHTQVFYTTRSNDLFRFWSAFVLLTVVTSVSEVIVIFLQPILFANTAAFFCSLLGFVSHTLQRATAVRKLARDGIASKRSITDAILRLC